MYEFDRCHSKELIMLYKWITMYHKDNNGALYAHISLIYIKILIGRADGLKSCIVLDEMIEIYYSNKLLKFDTTRYK